MGRIGVRTPQEAQSLTALIDRLPHVALTGCFTHMATADEDDAAGTRAQLARFTALCDAIAAVHPGKIIRHAANTACIFRYPQAHFDMVRGGIALYGYSPVPEVTTLRPAMRWTARAVYVKTIRPGDRVSYGGLFEAARPTRVMTVPVGYADGYRRGLTGKGCVLVRGRRAPILGDAQAASRAPGTGAGRGRAGGALASARLCALCARALRGGLHGLPRRAEPDAGHGRPARARRRAGDAPLHRARRDDLSPRDTP